MVKVYGIKNCDSVKKTLKFFQEHNIEYALFDFKKEILPYEKIEEWSQKVEMKTLFNKRSTSYRNLNLKELTLDEEGEKEWLCRENLLIKRPVVECEDDTLLVGFNKEIYQRKFL